MKSPADPYEFFRWKSSCGRLVVRTTWVKGVRHAILSDDDDDDVNKRTPPPKKERHARRPHRSNSENDAVAAKETADDDRLPSNVAAADDDYVERVLRWLHKPAGAMLETCRKPMSAPSAGHGACSSRRPALVKTCSIPGNKSERQQVVGIAERPMTTRSVVASAAGNCTKNRHKIELHVHMPSVC